MAASEPNQIGQFCLSNGVLLDCVNVSCIKVQETVVITWEGSVLHGDYRFLGFKIQVFGRLM